MAMTKANTTTKLPPLLRWAGGKRRHTWLFDAVGKVFNPAKHRLVEPFCGGLAIALGVEPQWALLNDKNPYLINFYSQVKNGLILDWQLKEEVAKDDFLENRNFFNNDKDLFGFYGEIDNYLAQLFYYLNRTCFNGLCRFNQSGEFNVPYGNLKSPKLDHDFDVYRDRFKDWIFTSMDFEQIEIHAHDIIVADPPYDVAGGKQDHDYVAGGFGWDDQVRLANWLASQTVPVFACNLATSRIINLYQGLGFDVQLVYAPRVIACNGDRRKVLEILASKNLEAAV